MKTYDDDSIDFSDYEELMSLYDKFETNCTETGWNGVLGVYSRGEVEDAYLLSKPVTVLEIVAPRTEVEEFSEDLEKFFFTRIIEDPNIESDEENYHHVYISRFKSLVDVADEFLSEELDKKADLAGILFGYREVDVAGYCNDQSKDLFK